MRRSGFTLLELLVSLVISSFILLALSQAYRSAMSFLSKSRSSMVLNRKVCLLFNQIERDLSTAFIPFLEPEIVPATDAKSDPRKQQSEKKPADTTKDEREQLKDFFLGVHGETMSAAFVYNDHPLKPFERLTFISTNPLLVYGTTASRLVRIAYEIRKEKFARGFEQESFQLIRKEGRDLKNAKMKISEFDYAEREKHSIDEQVMIEGVKAFYVQYIAYKEEKTKNQSENEVKKYEEIRLNTWGDKEISQGVVPAAVECTLVLWNQNYTAEHVYHMMVPIFSYPTEKPQKTSVYNTVQQQPKAGAAQGIQQQRVGVTPAPGGVQSVPGSQQQPQRLPTGASPVVEGAQ